MITSYVCPSMFWLYSLRLEDEVSLITMFSIRLPCDGLLIPRMSAISWLLYVINSRNSSPLAIALSMQNVSQLLQQLAYMSLPTLALQSACAIKMLFLVVVQRWFEIFLGTFPLPSWFDVGVYT